MEGGILGILRRFHLQLQIRCVQWSNVNSKGNADNHKITSIPQMFSEIKKENLKKDPKEDFYREKKKIYREGLGIWGFTTLQTCSMQRKKINLRNTELK